jgi:hypothetical protein
MSPTAVSTPHTRAWLDFEQNIDSISHMNYLAGREMSLVKAEAIRFKTFLNSVKSLNSLDPTKKATATKLLRSLRSASRVSSRYLKTLQSRIERFGTANLWQVVMLVTCVEAYLQDVLSASASIDPELMSESEQRALYADVIAADSLHELANELRARWARRWLSDGGPTRWISRLTRMGARGYPADLALGWS